MKAIRKFTRGAAAVAILPGLGGRASMSARDKRAAIGAGAVLTGGSAVGTVGGAAVGGVIGHEAAKQESMRLRLTYPAGASQSVITQIPHGAELTQPHPLQIELGNRRVK